jgi:thiamine biosynthesis protein ThiS
MPMRLTVNGEVREAPDSATLADLLASLGIESRRVAVERNREIAPRSQWSAIALQEGDQLEIVQFVWGG